MAPKNKPVDTASDQPSTAEPDQGTKLEDVVKPFQEASAKFLQANFVAQESAFREHTQANLALQDEIRKAEQEAYDSVMKASKKYLDNMGQQVSGSMEEMYLARAQSQVDYQNEVRRIYEDTQAKLKDIAEKGAADERGNVFKQIANQQQDAFQTYLADLQQAWAGTKAVDPQTMNAIAYNILFSLNR